MCALHLLSWPLICQNWILLFPLLSAFSLSLVSRLLFALRAWLVLRLWEAALNSFTNKQARIWVSYRYTGFADQCSTLLSEERLWRYYENKNDLKIPESWEFCCQKIFLWPPLAVIWEEIFVNVNIDAAHAWNRSDWFICPRSVVKYTMTRTVFRNNSIGHLFKRVKQALWIFFLTSMKVTHNVQSLKQRFNRSSHGLWGCSSGWQIWNKRTNPIPFKQSSCF